eukprot:g16900.t1
MVGFDRVPLSSLTDLEPHEWVFHPECAGAPVAIAFFCWETARQMEELSDKELTDRLLRILSETFDQALPELEASLVDVKRSGWQGDDFACGSYSFLPCGVKPLHRQRLQEPHGPRVFFAGEHCRNDFPSTVHGAYLSGLQAAKEELGRWVVKEAAWSEVFAAWKALEMAKPRSCHVHLRRRKQSGTWPSDVSLPLRRALATQLEETFGWTPEVVRSEAEMELQVVLGEDGRILVEIPLLVQTRGLSGGLPFPGMKQVEAWVLAKALQLQPGEVVLDPMCGKGTLLCEAAIWWPEASFIGCDAWSNRQELNGQVRRPGMVRLGAAW